MPTQQPAATRLSRETSPSRKFATPEKLLADMGVDPDKKARLLQRWAADLEDRMRLSDQNMPDEEPGLTGDLLRRVKTAQQQLAAV